MRTLLAHARRLLTRADAWIPMLSSLVFSLPEPDAPPLNAILATRPAHILAMGSTRCLRTQTGSLS